MQASQGTDTHQAALQQLSTVPGVAGGLVFGRAGDVLASRFPPTVERQGLVQLARRLADDPYFQEWLQGEDASLELRYGNGAAVVRPVGAAWLLVVCAPQVNPQLLAMSLTQATRRLQVAAAAAPPAPTRLDRLRATVEAELGAHAPQALEILAAAGEDAKALRRAADDVERLTKLFISTRKAGEIARKMKLILDG